MDTYEERAEALRARTKAFALDILRFVRTLPRSDEARLMGRQLMRSATSVAANYRAVCRARTRAGFVAKLDIVVEEADESTFWLEMIEEAGISNHPSVYTLHTESNELTRLFSAARRTAKRGS